MFRIPKNINFIVYIALTLFLIACSKQSPFVSSPSDNSSISTHLSFADEGITVASFDSLLLIITGEAVDTMKHALFLQGTQAQTQIKVPADVNLQATVIAYQDSHMVMSGSDSVIVQPNKTTSLSIKMNFIVPTIMLSKPNSEMINGDTLTVYLAAKSLQDLATIGAQVQFDPNKLQISEIGRKDSLLTSNGGTVNQLLFSKDNTNGTLDIVLGIFPSGSAINGSGKIGRIVFTAIDTGITDLAIRIDNDKDSNYALFDRNANLLYSLGIGGRITIQ